MITLSFFAGEAVGILATLAFLLLAIRPLPRRGGYQATREPKNPQPPQGGSGVWRPDGRFMRGERFRNERKAS